MASPARAAYSVRVLIVLRLLLTSITSGRCIESIVQDIVLRHAEPEHRFCHYLEELSKRLPASQLDARSLVLHVATLMKLLPDSIPVIIAAIVS